MKTTKTISPLIWGFIICSLIIIASCAGASNDMTENSSKESMSPTSAMDLAVEEGKSSYDELSMAKEKDAVADQHIPVPEQMPVVEKQADKIIRNADVRFEVENFMEVTEEMRSLIKQQKAYISNESMSNSPYNKEMTMVIRVQAPEFDALMEELQALAYKVDHANITAEDVTEQYVDLQTRLKTKKEAELRYVEILKKAVRINEILEVEEYIRNIREEIESVEGRLRYLNDKVSYSTITLTYYQTLNYISQPESGFFHRIGNAFVTGWNGLLAVIIGFFYIWPFWLIILVTLYVVLKLIKRSKKKKN